MRFLNMLVMVGMTTAPCAAQELGPAKGKPRPPLDNTVTIALERVSLKDALDEVARRAGVRIAYSGRVVPLDRSVSVQLDAVPVSVALDRLLKGTGAVPTVDGTGQILLVTNPPKGPATRQTGSIAGTIRDAASGTPLLNARVALVGTRFSVETGADGQYTIADVPPATYRIRARLVGYVPAEAGVTVQDGQRAVVDLVLQQSAIELNPVVAVGYATVQKQDLTGSVSSISADEFRDGAAPIVTLTNGLQAKAAGVQVTSNSGMPGAGLRVRVRGTGSISANSEPLYVIDGIPAEQGTASSDPKANPLMSIDVDGIESIDVLKDASATAIYGARGANGVVLITTKRGQTDRSRVTVETSYGFQRIAKTIPVLTGPEFMQFANEAAANAGLTQPYTPAQIASAPTYDYPSMMLRSCDGWRYCAAAPQASSALSFSGGNAGLRYFISGNYAAQDGIEIGSDFRRHGVRINLDGTVNERFRLGTSLSFTRVTRNAPRVENGSLGNSANGIQAAMQFAPFVAPKDAAGNWIKSSPTTEPVPNPIANALELKDLNTTTRLLGSISGEYDITPELRLKSTLGGNFQFNKIHFFAPRTVLDGGVGGAGWIFSEEIRNLTNENTLSYRRAALGPGDVDVLAGFAVQTFYGENIRGDGATFPTDETSVFNLGSGSQLIPAGSGIGESAILSYLARANYNIDGKYLFTVTGRYDGSSRFGANNKWAFFPSAAVAWRITDEGFMQAQSLFSDLKLRLSYGQVGNQAVESYQSLTQLNTQWYTAGGIEIPALAPGTRMPNPDLRWEQQTQLNLGIDAAFLDHRLTVTLDHYRSTTKDLLLVVPLPSTTGFTSQLRNIGAVRNRGVELSVGSLNLQRDRLTWRSSLNLAANRNKVLNLGVDSALFLSPRTGNFFAPGDIYVVKVGHPLGAIFGFEVNGLWQPGDQCYLTNTAQCTPGEYKIVDTNGDSTITAADRVILGYGDPKFYGGLSNTLSYGRFSLDVLLSFVSGNKVVNAGQAYGCAAIGQANERTCVRDRWTTTNTDTDVPRANRSRPRRLYSTFVEDGSYLRLQTLTLGYQLPTSWLRGVESAQLYVTGQNLWTVTGYSGFDPDVNSMGGDGRFGGIDIGAYPRTKTWNLGLSLTF